MEAEEILDLDSDHTAVVLTLSETAITKELKPSLVNKTTNWESFGSNLENSMNVKMNLETKDQL